MAETLPEAAPEPAELRRSPLRWLMQKRWRMTRSLTLGAQVCVIAEDGRVLLVRHGYRPGWHFPGGGVEIGEDVACAALRELEEETGVVARGAPLLHGIFNHHAIFPGDHVVLYVLRDFEHVRTPASGFEIAEQKFFAPDATPVETSAGTLRRLAEIFRSVPVAGHW